MNRQDDTIDVDPEGFAHIKHGKKRLFLQCFVQVGTIRQAAKQAQITRPTIYNWSQDDPEFFAAFEDAKELAFGVMEQEAKRRALEGRRKLVLHQGKPVQIPIDPANPNGDKEYLYDYIYSDTLLMFLMKGAKPHIYRDVTTPMPQPEREAREGYQDLDDLPPEVAEKVLEEIDAARRAKEETTIASPDQGN